MAKKNTKNAPLLPLRVNWGSKTYLIILFFIFVILAYILKKKLRKIGKMGKKTPKNAPCAP